MSSNTPSPIGIPWQTPEAWRSAHAVLRYTFSRKRAALVPALATAKRMAGRIEMLDKVMEGLCAQTCPHCTAICCRHATVWYDFKDVVFLHLVEAELPPGQAVTGSGPPCRFLTSDGCVLPRHRRPFICLWYICPAQASILGNTNPGVYDHFREQLEGLKHDRRVLEDQVVGALI